MPRSKILIHNHKPPYSEWCFQCLQDRVKNLEVRLAEKEAKEYRIAGHLRWMIATLDFQKEQCRIDSPDSPELADARALLAELEGEE